MAGSGPGIQTYLLQFEFLELERSRRSRFRVLVLFNWLIRFIAPREISRVLEARTADPELGAQPNFNNHQVVKHCQFPSFLGQQHTTANMEAIFDKVPNVVTTFFAAIGFVFLGSKVIGYIQLLLSLFVLSGKNVRSLNTHNPSIT
jgi:hypothetical protein